MTYECLYDWNFYTVCMHAYGNVLKNFGEVCLCSFQVMWMDRQTDRQRDRHTHTHTRRTYHDTLHCSRGKVITVHNNVLWMCLQCFDAVGQAAGRTSGLWKLSGEVLVWLSVWSKVQMICIWSSWCHYHPIISCFIEIQNVLHFRCQFTHVVLEMRPLNGSTSSSNNKVLWSFCHLPDWLS